MTKQLQKSLHDYLSKIKKETGKIHLSSRSFSSSKNWVLSGCKHPKSLSFSSNGKHRRKRGSKSKSESKDYEDEDDGGQAATLSDIDRFLEENFKSLCVRDHDDDDGVTDSARRKKKLGESDGDDDDNDDRFRRAWGPALYDSPEPWRSEPMKEEVRPSMTATTTTAPKTSMTEDIPSSSNSSAFGYGGRSGETTPSAVLPENCIAVLRYTPDPQEDFRQSMVEMVEARLGAREWDVDWDFMEELLFCYLDLNEKKSHRYILSAFVDLVIVLRQKEKTTVTKNGFIRSLSTRIARDRLRRRMKRPS
ncbi:PREDICTED: transcription repressor OFP14-like [Tarenaya hassleriana]|uniref:transcription repressor OFP14-like n=1 Tax=Tarenaya hassleriana TaxID=28532 RepID=UPI00053C7B45|nr:PREDICTED: transcription repressor OFP14-like [Tarenaya hassleriana]